MRPLYTQLIEQANAVGRHIRKPIGCLHRLAAQQISDQLIKIRHAGRFKFLAQTNVAVVVTDREVTRLGEAL